MRFVPTRQALNSWWIARKTGYAVRTIRNDNCRARPTVIIIMNIAKAYFSAIVTVNGWQIIPLWRNDFHCCHISHPVRCHSTTYPPRAPSQTCATEFLWATSFWNLPCQSYQSSTPQRRFLFTCCTREKIFTGPRYPRWYNFCPLRGGGFTILAKKYKTARPGNSVGFSRLHLEAAPRFELGNGGFAVLCLSHLAMPPRRSR